MGYNFWKIDFQFFGNYIPTTRGMGYNYQATVMHNCLGATTLRLNALKQRKHIIVILTQTELWFRYFVMHEGNRYIYNFVV